MSNLFLTYKLDSPPRPNKPELSPSLFLAIHYTQVDDSISSGPKGQNIIAQGRVSEGTNRNAALGKEVAEEKPSVRIR